MRNGTIPLGDKKAFYGVSFCARDRVMMAPQDSINLTKRFGPLHRSIALPEHRKSLATDTAAGSYLDFGALQKYLHPEISRSPPGVSQPRCEGNFAFQSAIYPIQGLSAILRVNALLHGRNSVVARGNAYFIRTHTLVICNRRS